MKGLKVLVLSALLAAVAVVMLAPTDKARAGASACATASVTAQTMFNANGFRKGLVLQNISTTVTASIAVGVSCVAGSAGNAIQIAPGAYYEEPTSACSGTSSCVPTGAISICTASSVASLCGFEW